MSVEKESGDERQTVKQVQKKRRARVTEKRKTATRCAHAAHTDTSSGEATWKTTFIYALILSSALQSLFSAL